MLAVTLVPAPGASQALEARAKVALRSSKVGARALRAKGRKLALQETRVAARHRDASAGSFAIELGVAARDSLPRHVESHDAATQPRVAG